MIYVLLLFLFVIVVTAILFPSIKYSLISAEKKKGSLVEYVLTVKIIRRFRKEKIIKVVGKHYWRYIPNFNHCSLHEMSIFDAMVSKVEYEKEYGNMEKDNG